MEHAYRLLSAIYTALRGLDFAAALGCGLRALCLLCLICCCAQADSYYLTVSGLGGEPDYEAEFARFAGDLDKQLKRNGSTAHVETLSGASATREHTRALLNKWSNQVTAEDSFALFLIGHGTFDGTDYKFNVPGPDISAADLRRWLNEIKADRQLIVDMTSASGVAMPLLVAKNRIVMTATKSGNEKNATVFPRYFVDAFHDPAADTNKNGVVSALEAFRYTQQKVAAYFVEEKLIPSEHALFSDNGSAESVRDPGPQNQQGLLAAAFPLLHITAGNAVAMESSPAKQKLITRKDQLEAQIDRLKYQKSSLPEAEYKRQLTGLLLDLARTQAEIDQ